MPACNKLIANLEAQIEPLRRQVRNIIAVDEQLQHIFDLLVSVTGIAAASAIQLLGELLVLPDDMSAKQWVAMAGLDPRTHQSGSSVNEKPRRSKAGNRYLRIALFMPALSAERRLISPVYTSEVNFWERGAILDLHRYRVSTPFAQPTRLASNQVRSPKQRRIIQDCFNPTIDPLRRTSVFAIGRATFLRPYDHGGEAVRMYPAAEGVADLLGPHFGHPLAEAVQVVQG